MKKGLYITLLFSLFSLLSYSQDKMIRVTYGKKMLNTENIESNNQAVIDRINKTNKGLKFVEYELIADKDKCYSSYIEIMDNEGSKTFSRSITSGGMEGKYFSTTNQTTKALTTIGENFLITYSPAEKYNWKLTSEKKVIGNYTCYKATTLIQIDDLRGKNEYPVSVWFASDLPYSFGPSDYFGNLPGLVLEVNVNDRIIIYAKKIDFIKPIKLQQIKKGKKVTLKEYNDIMQKVIKKMMQ